MLLNKPDLLHNARIVKACRHAVEFCNLDQVPAAVRELLKTGAWCDRYEMMHHYTFEQFPDFITSPVAKGGCGWDPGNVEVLLKKSGDAEALVLFRKAMVGEHGGDRKSDKAAIKPDNISLDPQHGTSRAYTLSRLKREHADLFDKVKAGKMSANAAAIKAGFRKQYTPFERILKLLPKLTCIERQALRAAIEEHREAAE